MQDNKHLNGYVDERDDIEYETDSATVDTDKLVDEINESLAHATANDELDGDGIDDGGFDSSTMPHDTPANFYPICRYCGQIKLPLAAYASQDAANEAATRECDCPDARIYQADIERKEKRDQNIKRLTQRLDDLSEYCEKRSVDLDGDLYDTLFNTSVAVLDNIIDSAQLKFARMRVSVSLNNKGNLAIKFTYTDGATVEV